jgi:hypothetical protein
VSDKVRFGGSSYRVAGNSVDREVRTYEDGRAPSFVDPSRSYDVPDAPDLPYNDMERIETNLPTNDWRDHELAREVEESITFEEPPDGTPRAEADRFSDEQDAASGGSLESGSPWRVRLRNGVEYAFPDEGSVVRFALKGTVGANDLVSSDSGANWRAAWELGIGADDGFADFTPTHTTLVTRPRKASVNWLRVALLTTALVLATVLLFQEQANRGRPTSIGVFQSPLAQWYDSALGTVAQTPRPSMKFPESPPRPIPVRELPPVAPKELQMRIATAADHAAVGKDALDRGAWEDAATAYRHALELDPNNGSYKIALADAAKHLLEQGAPE